MYPQTIAGGLIYTQKAVDASMKCAYAVDAYSTLRSTDGWGCTLDTDGFMERCVKSASWNCLEGKSCEDKDPIVGDKLNAN